MDANTDKLFPDKGDKVNVIVSIFPGLLREGSQIVLNAPGSEVAHTGDISGKRTCHAQKLAAVQKNYTVDLCQERSIPCQQLCKKATGTCHCHAGYIISEETPENCVGE